jgi:hypothetical protein
MKLMEIYRQIVREAEAEYRVQHSAPGKDDAPLYDLTKNDIIPDDIYSRNAIRYYGTGFDDNFNFAVILKAKGKPNLPITIYRSVPPNVNEINPGDWVTLSKKYAKTHMEGELGWKILSKKVKASEVYTDGNSWDEWGWNP